MNTQNVSEQAKLKSVKQLLQESWQIYRLKAQTLIGIMAISVALNLSSKFDANLWRTFGENPLLFFVISILLFAVSLFYIFFYFFSHPFFDFRD